MSLCWKVVGFVFRVDTLYIIIIHSLNGYDIQYIVIMIFTIMISFVHWMVMIFSIMWLWYSVLWYHLFTEWLWYSVYCDYDIQFYDIIRSLNVWQLEETVRNMVMRYGSRIWKLRVMQAEIKMTIRLNCLLLFIFCKLYEYRFKFFIQIIGYIWIINEWLLHRIKRETLGWYNDTLKRCL